MFGDIVVLDRENLCNKVIKFGIMLKSIVLKIRVCKNSLLIKKQNKKEISRK